MYNPSDVAAPWVLVSGGFHRRGAMDLANLSLAEHLLRAGREVHLVGHDIDPVLAARRGAHEHRVPRAGTVALGELLLERTARHLTVGLGRNAPALHVVANGGNFATADVNWVHSVHHAWPADGTAGSFRHRTKRRIEARLFRRREARAFARARLLIANSARTRDDLVEHFSLDPDRVHVVHPGVDPSWEPATTEQRRNVRLQFGISGTAVLFIGALGADDNKGFGHVLEAWRILCADSTWNGTLLVCGSGPLAHHWKAAALRLNLQQRVRFLGFLPAVGRVLGAADLLVSASKYESYGLAIAEALCRGVPAVLPASAGIAASLDPAYEGLLVRGTADAQALAATVRRWSIDPPRWRAVASIEGAKLRQHTLENMSVDIARVVES